MVESSLEHISKLRHLKSEAEMLIFYYFLLDASQMVEAIDPRPKMIPGPKGCQKHYFWVHRRLDFSIFTAIHKSLL